MKFLEEENLNLSAKEKEYFLEVPGPGPKVWSRWTLYFYFKTNPLMLRLRRQLLVPLEGILYGRAVTLEPRPQPRKSQIQQPFAIRKRLKQEENKPVRKIDRGRHPAGIHDPYADGSMRDAGKLRRMNHSCPSRVG